MWIKNVTNMSSDYTFYHLHNKINPNTLPKNLTTLTFGFHFMKK